MNEEITNRENPLGELPTGQLLRKFAIPSIIAMLVSSLYNIVDQFFIGNTVGSLGNAATNIVFPLNISCVAIILLCGIGGASAFNLAMGAGKKEEAAYYIGNAISLLLIGSLVLAALSLIFTEPLLRFFGSPEDVLPYAMTYTRVCAFGFPCLVVASGCAHLIRADGSPKYTMAVNMTGAIVNVILDALFVFILGWGMFGAALATVIGQAISLIMVLVYLPRFHTVKLQRKHFAIKGSYIGRLTSLGTAPCFNQLAMMVVQIVLNKSLKYYGGMSVYGESIPIACVGIVTKVSQIVGSFVIGISQGVQPIVSFNYGAKKYDRVKRAYLQAIGFASIFSTIGFLLFQLIPEQIIGIFGTGSEEYVRFAVRYFRIYLAGVSVFFFQPISANFFTSIGKPKVGIFTSLTRQIIFLIPLILLLPIFWGIDGIMYAGPVADFSSFFVCLMFIIREFSKPEFKEKRTDY